MNTLKKFGIYILLILLSLPTIFPIFNEGFFTMHDDTQIVRVQQMYQAITDGQFPVRWVADLGYGYGYPLFNFYGPLPYYFGALCIFLGASLLVATKIMFVVGILGAVITMFLLAQRIWGTFPAIIVSILYQYAPYHAVDIYVRGAVSEFWAIAILPLVFLGIVLVEKEKIDKKRNYAALFSHFLLISISFAALIVTHNITALITSVFLGIGILSVVICTGIAYVVGHILAKSVFIKLGLICGALLFGLGLSAFFWIPAFSENSYTNVQSVIGAGADYHDHFVYLEQLWDSPWGFGGSAQGKADGMSFKAGKIHIVLPVFSLILLVWQFLTNSANRRLIVYTICIVITTLFAIFMSTSYSQPVWDSVPLFAFIQYPWRFLVFIILGLSLGAGGLFTLKRDIFVILLSSLLLITILYVNIKYFVPQQHIVLNESVYISNQYTRWWVSRISDEYMPKGFKKPITITDIVQEKIVFEPEVNVVGSVIKTDRYHVTYNSLTDSVAHINLAFFPGWMVYIDGNNHPYSILDDGIEVMIPAGIHTIQVKRLDTPLERAANYISLFCLVAIFGTMMGLKYVHVKKI